MNNILEKLSEHIIVGAHEIKEYTDSEVLDLIVLLHANKIDPVLESMAEAASLLMAESNQNIVSTAIQSIKRHLDENYEVSELVVKKRKRRRRPNSKLSRIAKQRYRRNRVRIKRGLSKFRKSSKGKQFYKALGKFNTRNKNYKSPNRNLNNNANENYEELINYQEVFEIAIVITSSLSHLLIFLKENYLSLLTGDPEEDLSMDDLSDIVSIVGAALEDVIESLSTGNPNEMEGTLDEVIGTISDLFTEYEVEFEE